MPAYILNRGGGMNVSTVKGKNLSPELKTIVQQEFPTATIVEEPITLFEDSPNFQGMEWSDDD